MNNIKNIEKLTYEEISCISEIAKKLAKLPEHEQEKLYYIFKGMKLAGNQTATYSKGDVKAMEYGKAYDYIYSQISELINEFHISDEKSEEQKNNAINFAIKFLFELLTAATLVMIYPQNSVLREEFAVLINDARLDLLHSDLMENRQVAEKLLLKMENTVKDNAKL